MIRLFAALVLSLSLVLPAVAQESDALTVAEVDEVAGLVEALIVGGGDYAQAETAARQFYDLVLQDFGPETRQAVQIEFVMVLAAAAQDQQDRAQALGLQLMEKEPDKRPQQVTARRAQVVTRRPIDHLGAQFSGYGSQIRRVADSFQEPALDYVAIRVVETTLNGFGQPATGRGVKPITRRQG